MQIVLATRNQGKLLEMRTLFADLAVELLTQVDLDIPSPAETGLTFVENALIKARAVSAAAGLPAIADDSGLVVPALGGQPGIYSARFAGTQGEDRANNDKLLALMENEVARAAYFTCSMVFLASETDPSPIVVSGTWAGEITSTPMGTDGFGYDPLFFVPTHGCTAAQLNAGNKNEISHRGQASRSLKRMLAAYLQTQDG